MTTRTSHSSSSLGAVAALVALVAAMAALGLAYNASPAHAAGSCSTTSGTTTCTFGSTGAEDTFVVPEGVSTIHVVAQGAPGAVGSDGDSAGLGAQVSGDLTVTPGQTLYVNVGGAPTGSGPSDCLTDVACNGGFNGGGSSGWGGGGGGASDVRSVSRDQSGSLGSRLIVAGGGGGSGAGADRDHMNCPQSEQPILLGGAGGDAGSPGSQGAWCGDIPTGLPGGGAGYPGDYPPGQGGLGGGPNGQDGSLGQGGGSGQGTGGGGGGGNYGGGSGGDFNFGDDPVDPYDGPMAAGGGGGGGSNLVPEGGTATIVSGDPSIVISYQAGLGEPPPTEEPENKQACKKGGFREFGFKNQGPCIKAVNHAN